MTSINSAPSCPRKQPPVDQDLSPSTRVTTVLPKGGIARDDFQWPWYPLEGDDWDGEQRMEGWGCGEWSELKAR